MIRSISELNVKDKTVFVRVDFNVPIHNGAITETHRIDSTLPTLRLIFETARSLTIASHLGRPAGKKDPAFSLAPVRDYLEKSLSQPVTLAPDCVGEDVERMARNPQNRILLLENLRFHKEEEANDPAFSRALASLADVYVNDAFGAAHRAHASVAGMVKFCRQKAAGLLLQRELDYIGQILSSPKKPLWALLGGAKVSDKIGVLQNLLPRLDGLLIGGGMAYTFLKARGMSVGRSLVEEDRLALAREILARAEERNLPLLLPSDHVAARDVKAAGEARIVEGGIGSDLMGLDIGPKTIAEFTQQLAQARMVLWNGPLGLFEDKRFFQGTKAIAEFLSQSKTVTVVAGGDTVAAVRQAGVEDRIAHLSTGGGATLEFLEGKKLPGIQALEEEG